MCICAVVGMVVQGFFGRRKWSIVLEGKWSWQESRKYSYQSFCVTGWDVERRLCGLESKGFALKQNPVKEVTVF